MGKSMPEAAFEDGVKQYRYTLSHNPDGSEGVVFWDKNIHTYGDFVWTHPARSFYLRQKNGCKSKFADGVQLNHFPDEAKSRSNYLPLLELSVKESQDNDRNMHYLGGEYMFHRDYDKAITTLTKRLAMLSAS